MTLSVMWRRAPMIVLTTPGLLLLIEFYYFTDANAVIYFKNSNSLSLKITADTDWCQE